MLFRKFFNRHRSGKNDENSESGNDDLVEQFTEQAKQLAYKKILQQSRFVELDGLNEYDGNYRHFIPRGELLTVEMRNALERLDALKKQTQQADEGPALQEDIDSGGDKEES